MPYHQQQSTAVQSVKLTELKVETDPQAELIKTNRSERQDSPYLDNKVMLAIFVLNTVLIYQTL